MAIYQLSWSAPTTRSDGTDLPAGEIAGYVVRRVFNSVTTEFEAATNSYLLDIGADSGTGTLTVAAVDFVGSMSSFVAVPNVQLYNNLPALVTRMHSISARVIVTDADADPLTFSVSTQATKGTASITNNATGLIKYTPTVGQTGTDTFTIKCTDGRAGGDVFQIFNVNLTDWSISTTYETITAVRG